MKWIVFCLFSFSSAAFADLSQNAASFTAFEMLNPILPDSIPTTQLKKGRWDFKIVPAYLTYEEDEQSAGGRTFQELDGWGGGLASTYSFSNHWGVSMMAVGFSADGEGVIFDNVAETFGENEASGFGGIAALIYDPFNKGDKSSFRLPLTFGIGYFSLEQEATHADAGGSLTSTRKLDSLSITLGLAAQFAVLNWLQVSPFVMLSEPLDDATDECTATGTATCPTLQSVSKNVGTMGVELTYIPWQLGFSYVPQIGEASAITLKWQFSAGD